MTRGRLALPDCRVPWPLTMRRRLAAALQALLPRRAPETRTCLDTRWDDDDGLAGARVPRRPRRPRPGGAVALELPDPETGAG